MPVTNRRELLLLAGSAVAAVAGCSTLVGSDSLRQVEVQNFSRQHRQFRITVSNDDGTTLYDETFSLDGRMVGGGTQPFSGTPARITITVDGETPIETDWPTRRTEIRNGSAYHVEDGCGSIEGETITGVFVYVIDPDRVSLRPTCATVR
jgi:hypothetical protein